MCFAWEKVRHFALNEGILLAHVVELVRGQGHLAWGRHRHTSPVDKNPSMAAMKENHGLCHLMCLKANTTPLFLESKNNIKLYLALKLFLVCSILDYLRLITYFLL